MPVFSNLRHTWYTSLSIGIALLFALYSIVGWLVLPGLIRNQVIVNLKQIANWDTQIENVQFNPYALSLEVESLATFDANGEKQVGFGRLYVNFAALRSLDGTLAFSAIELDAPYVNLTLDQAGVTNLQRAFASSEADPEPAVSKPLALFFENIALSSGQLELNDHSKPEAFHLNLQPLSLNLVEFATNNNEGGDYRLDISLGNDQMLRWTGQIGIAPLTSSGQLALENLQLTTFWHYLKPISPFWLNQGLNQATLSGSGAYVLDNSGAKTELRIDQGRAVFNDLSLASAENAPEFLTLRQLTVAPIRFDLAQQKAEIGTIELDTLKATLVRDAKGLLPVLEQLKTAQSESAEPNASESASPVQWSVGEVKLLQGELNWQDKALAAPATLTVTMPELTLSGLTQDLTQPLPYQGKGQMGEAPFALAGKLTPMPFRAEGEFTLDTLPLALLQNYVSEYSHVSISTGTASLQTHYALSQQDNALQGSIKSDLTVNTLALSDADGEQTLAGFDALTISPLELTLPQRAITIGTLALNKPYGEVFISEDGELNLTALVKSVDSATPANAEKKEPETAPLALSLAKVEITDGRFSFSDSSQQPPFATRLTELNGQIDDLSSDPAQRSSVSIGSKLDSSGQVSIKGTLNPLRPVAHTELKIKVKNIDLTPTSPYAARFLGYPIKKGKLALEIDYLRKGAKLKADNNVLLNQFTLGKQVKSPEALDLDLPLPFALALLSDGDGNIALDLPIKGDIDDPNFSVGSIVLTAFTNLLTKTVASPFSVLGSLIGSDSKDMSTFEFPPGKSEIGASQHERLRALSDALNKRPTLTLEVKGVADQTPDKLAMQHRKLEKRLGSEPERIRDELIPRWLSAEQAQALKAIADPQERILRTDVALQNAIPVKPVELSDLASQRAQNLVAWLSREGKVAEDRLFVVTPAIVDSGARQKTSVASEFGLGAR